MRIGFANIYSFRPHVEHLLFLANMMRANGHDVYFLTCDASVSACYPRLLKGTGKVKECSKCILGGVRSFTTKNITSIKDSAPLLAVDDADNIALSSSCTLNRTESEDEWNEPDVLSLRQSLHEPVTKVHSNAMSWIKKQKLDAVVCFNGRMDLTRAVTFACEQSNIPFVTHERTWFGDGLQLIPNANCLSLEAVGKMSKEYSEKPLALTQAQIAGKFAGERFLQRNSLEWRLYNKNPEPADWPLNNAGLRVLVLPSSKNEFAGHKEWETGWKDNTLALDDLFEAFSIDPGQVVVRCHPNWSENIGRVEGRRSLELYEGWAKKKNIHCISSSQRLSTYDLIQQADIVVMNGGSSAIEAGVCGKQVICLGPSPYQHAGFVRTFLSREELYRSGAMSPIDTDAVVRKTLRFIYLRSHRFAQYVSYVKAKETTRYEYVSGADPQRLVNMFSTGELVADNLEYAESIEGENVVMNDLKNKNWSKLADYTIEPQDGTELRMQRLLGLRWIDSVRAMRPRGDR